MSRAVALAALLSVFHGAFLLESKASNPRGAHPPGLGLGEFVCRGGVSRRLAGLRGGGGRDRSGLRGCIPGNLPIVIKDCKDIAGLLKLVDEHGPGFKAIHLGAAWGSLAKMRGSGGRGAEGVVIQRLQALTKAKASDLGARQVANILHSMAKMEERGRTGADDELADKLLTRALATARDFEPQHVANLVWALAKMDIEADELLLEAMQGQATVTARDFKPQEVANLVWALATMDIEADPRLLEAMQGRATATAKDFLPQGVSNLVWALATMGVKADARLLEAMQGRAAATARDFNPQEVSNLVLALAKMGVKADPRLLESMQGRATATAGDFNAQDVTNLVCALATMGVKADARMLEAMQERSTATARDFIPQNVANLVLALAKMGVNADPRLLEAMLERATATAGDFNTQDITNLFWALACFDTSPSQLSLLVVESMAVRLLSLREQLSVEGKRQMHQWLLFCDLHPEWRGQLPRSMQKVKEELGGAFRQAFAREAPITSQTQADVAKQLRRLFPELEVEEEYEDPKSGYSIDSRVSGAGRVWAVEVDGPTHFLKGGSGREPSGSTLLKRRQLGELGYTAVAVPYWEWNDLEGKGEEQLRRYLQHKLRIDQDLLSSRSVPDGEGRD